MGSNRSRCIAVTFGTATGGLLAVGLGIGAVLAATQGVASADLSTDPYSWIDELLGGLSVPAQTSALDMQVSIDGFDLFPTAGNTAIAGSGLGDIAIALGANSSAGATGGIFDVAFADGNGAFADAFGSLDTATAVGTNSQAFADGIFDAGFADGANSVAIAQLGSFDSAFVDGTNSGAEAGGIGGIFNPWIFPPITPGIPGSFDLAAVFGDMLHATATGGNFLADIVP